MDQVSTTTKSLPHATAALGAFFIDKQLASLTVSGSASSYSNCLRLSSQRSEGWTV